MTQIANHANPAKRLSSVNEDNINASEVVGSITTIEAITMRTGMSHVANTTERSGDKNTPIKYSTIAGKVVIKAR